MYALRAFQLFLDTDCFQEREPFVQAAKRTPVDLREWAVGLIERDNRKSHLAPQLSPSTQALLRSNDSPTTAPPQSHSPDFSSLPTPTSGDIPIAKADGRSNYTPAPYHESNGNRSPIKSGSSSVGRAGGAHFHPGLPNRTTTTNSIPKVTTLSAPDFQAQNGSHSANATSFSTTSLPIRPAPPAGPLPPPPVPRKENGEEKARRQATFAPYSGYSGERNY